MATIEEVLKKLMEAWNKFSDWISTGLGWLGSFFSAWISALSDALDA